MSESKTILIGDFGLAEDLYSRGQKQSDVRLPVKWMPPESLKDGVSNERTDMVYTNNACKLFTFTIETSFPLLLNSGLYKDTGDVYAQCIVLLAYSTYSFLLCYYVPLSFAHTNAHTCLNSYSPRFLQWSYGVTCWEVFSLGRSPYPGIENHEILQHISTGERLRRPSLCPEQL